MPTTLERGVIGYRIVADRGGLHADRFAFFRRSDGPRSIRKDRTALNVMGGLNFHKFVELNRSRAVRRQ